MATETAAAEACDDADTIFDIIAELPGKFDILFEIFTRLPPKSLFIFKSVSKIFLDLFNQSKFTAKHYVTFRRSAITAFIYQSIDLYLNDPIFLSIEHPADPLPDHCLCFIKQRNIYDRVELLDSCNGLLLCSNIDWVTDDVTLFVCNPSTKEKVSLPDPKLPYERLYFALLADFIDEVYLQYKVVCLYRRSLGGPCHSGSKILILSSEAGEWEEIKYEFPPVCHETLMGSKVFVNGTLYWDCLEGHILVYRLNTKKNQSFYELVKAPRAPLGRCLWKCENDKLHCYCHGFSNEFPAWSLSVDEKKNEYKWELDGCEEFKALTDDASRMFTEGWTLKKMKAQIPRVRFKIIGYEPKSKTMFLLISNLIFSYQLSDRSFSLLGGVGPNHFGYYVPPRFQSFNRFLPYVHSFGRIQRMDTAKAEDHGDIEEEEKDQDYSTAIDEHEKRVLTYEKLANKVKGKRK